MDNKEILEKALEKAVKNRYGKEQVNSFWRVLNEYEFQYEMRSVLIKSLLFDHDFAKAFFREMTSLYDKDRICLHCGISIDMQPPPELGCNHVYYPETCGICNGKTKDWQCHLQKMVLDIELLKYIERFLIEKE